VCKVLVLDKKMIRRNFPIVLGDVRCDAKGRQPVSLILPSRSRASGSRRIHIDAETSNIGKFSSGSVLPAREESGHHGQGLLNGTENSPLATRTAQAITDTLESRGRGWSTSSL
jgi:hypothetical protein